MIGKTLQELLEKRNMNVNELSKIVGVSNQTLYSIIKRDNMTIDIGVLLKISEALGVSADVFYYGIDNYNGLILTSHEKEVIKGYRLHPEMNDAVDKLLDIEKAQSD